MKVYFSSPGTQQQAEHVSGMPVLLSFATWRPWLSRYQQTFSNIMIDSGAFSELNTGVKIDLDKYAEWSQQWIGHADAIAGLDDISGDWKRSLDNYQRFPGGFPTMHDTDPPELLKDLVQLCIERKQWLGLGLKPPRRGKEDFVRWVCDNVPEDLHIHGWALRTYSKVRRINSFDSTNWFRDAMDLRVMKQLQHLTYGETLDIVIKRYVREQRDLKNKGPESTSPP